MNRSRRMNLRSLRLREHIQNLERDSVIVWCRHLIDVTWASTFLINPPRFYQIALCAHIRLVLL
ncbi:hypothetical protein [uncultured Helicobacter sp.]|uniref:hypothetical protein n=1 Tax=uncultured Helicobacter sp. TaxID=175537 RepID=UPI00374E42A7